MEKKFKQAVELLEAVLLYNDEKSTLRQKIETFLKETGVKKDEPKTPKTLTKKEFKEMISYHPYRGGGSKGFNALFFDWKTGDNFNGFKYCIWARTENATKKELEETLYDFITGENEDIPWYIQLIIAPTDELRFKVPLSGNGLNSLISAKKHNDYLESLKKQKAEA
jgi:hypothetical protein